MNYAWAIGMKCCHDKNLITILYCLWDSKLTISDKLSQQWNVFDKMSSQYEIMNYPTRTVITIALRNNCPKEIEIT